MIRSSKKVSRRRGWSDKLVCERFVPSWAFPWKLNCTVEVYSSVVLIVVIVIIVLLPSLQLYLPYHFHSPRFVGLAWCSCDLPRRVVCSMRWHVTPSDSPDSPPP